MQARRPARTTRRAAAGWRRTGPTVASSRTACGCGGSGARDRGGRPACCRTAWRRTLVEIEDPTAPGRAAPARALPEPPAVRDHLADARGLCPQLLDRCCLTGLLYADSRRNAVFLCRDSVAAPTGAELVGTLPPPSGSRRFRGMAPGSRKILGGFWLPPADARWPPASVLLVESAIDALSARLLPSLTLPPATLIASASGVAARLPRWLHPFRRLPLLCGYDADPAGDQAADSLRRSCPSLRRLRPDGAKDWNDLFRQTPPPNG